MSVYSKIVKIRYNLREWLSRDSRCRQNCRVCHAATASNAPLAQDMDANREFFARITAEDYDDHDQKVLLNELPNSIDRNSARHGLGLGC